MTQEKLPHRKELCLQSETTTEVMVSYLFVLFIIPDYYIFSTIPLKKYPLFDIYMHLRTSLLH